MGKAAMLRMMLVAVLMVGLPVAVAQGPDHQHVGAAPKPAGLAGDVALPDPGVDDVLRTVAYELQEGSTLSYTYWNDDSTEPITITVDIRGTFCRKPTTQVRRYDLSMLRFYGLDTSTLISVTGKGWYEPCNAAALPERMVLHVDITGFPQPQDIPIVLDSGAVADPQGPFPTIIIDLLQISTSVRWYYSAHLIATPRRYVDFSTLEGFPVVDPSGTDRWISDGDLLRDTGRIVRTNYQLMRNFGIMPPVPDVGLDGVSRCPFCPADCCADVADVASRCVLFTMEQTIWSETLATWLGHGDLLCECGFIFRTNAQLIQQFYPISSIADVGLDAVDVRSNGEVWFSTDEGFWGMDENGETFWVSPDDLLSDQGYVVRPIWRLLERFHPLGPIVSPGLDGVAVLPNGEIYFSVEEGFFDAVYGPISAGDLLSDAGYVVARNYELVRSFHPMSVRDVGLDALNLGPEQPCVSAEVPCIAELE